MTVDELRDRLIADGIEEVERVYPEGDYRRLGSIEGFELCRGLSTRDEFKAVLIARCTVESEMRSESPFTPEEATRYWEHRYATLQVEWILNCLIVGVWAREGEMVSGRALRKIVEMVRVTPA